jgi:hypothetical protein
MRSPKLDRIDVNILIELQRDGRITDAQLADAVGLSPSPCFLRLQQAGFTSPASTPGSTSPGSVADQQARVHDPHAVRGSRLSHHPRVWLISAKTPGSRPARFLPNVIDVTVS